MMRSLIKGYGGEKMLGYIVLENSTFHSHSHENSKSHTDHSSSTSEDIKECEEQNPQNKAMSTSIKACSSSSPPTLPFVFKRERLTLNVQASSQFSITKKK
jgi:hypothetical protein